MFTWKQTILTHIRLLPWEQSDLGPYCLQYRLSKNISRREQQTTKVVTGGLRVNKKGKLSTYSSDFSECNDICDELPIL